MNFSKKVWDAPFAQKYGDLYVQAIPRFASDYAYIDATLDHADNSVYAEQFLAAAEALAFFESDMLTLINKSMEYIPQDCRLRKCFDDVICCYNGGRTGKTQESWY